MKSLFFYGTLRHVPLLSIVLGRPADLIEMRAASLADHAVHWADGQAFPMIVEGGDGAEGVVVSGLSDEDVARLNFYEGGFDYALKPVTVDTSVGAIATEVYFPEPGSWPQGELWSLEAWSERWGEMSCFAAREVMGYFGEKTAGEVADLFPMIRARATAKVNAKARNLAHSPSGFGAQDARVHRVKRPYVKYFALDEYDLTFRRYDGGQSEMVNRAVFLATDAMIVLPYDPVRDRVLLVEQFRPGPLARGDERPWQLEPIAGRVDAGETPEKTAHREAQEEAGIELRELHDVAHCYASPGCSTEYYDIYIGIADLPDGIDGVSGLESEAEDIRSYLFGFEDLMEMVDTMQAVNAPLVLAALWLARHRDRLRNAA
ncbi:NUDIX domain-containing protein [Shimia sp. CNT1-13L.2]|uniref:NUDIX domain-containing protein n=1 Tax=Shimia sp. CNT1-13L.2 TaxID=2959663 RepID=UPI0020CC9014|nr:NUDIX domain-containing protein [Shimia sp. CNT1-13L.2]